MPLINTNLEYPKLVLHNGDTITLAELAIQILQFSNKGDLIVGTGVEKGQGSVLPVGADGLFLKADSGETLGFIWSAPAGSGDVVGPASSVNDHIVLFNGTSGKAIKSSIKTLADVFADHVALGDPHSQYALDSDLSSYQPIDALLTSLATLNLSGNSLKVLRANVGETNLEWYTLPTGGGDLLAANNLSDLVNATTARTNLGLAALAVLATVGAGQIDANAITTAKILNSNVTLAKLADIGTSRFLGRVTATTGVVEELTVAQAKTILALVKGDVGLGNVDNTSDLAKPVSTAQQTALDGKVDDAQISNMDNTADVNKVVAGAVEWDGAVKTVSTSPPSGGNAGDIHFQYTA